ncbi:SpoIIE family protein phosphatase [Streptomyces sp. NPDC088358]|uniref:ATP-binding SpoIIE family protein phosphatase n=1 Tax=Streptomyces sp. NPDC088358 TaxID=3365857 RepID=UPI0038033DB0
MQAHETWFTLTEEGGVTDWTRAAAAATGIAASDAEGSSAGQLLGRLLGPDSDCAFNLEVGRDTDDGDIHVWLVRHRPEDTMGSVFDESVAGLEIYDLGLTVRRSNPAALALRGLPADQVVNRPVADLGPGLPLTPLLDQVLTGCLPALSQEIRGHDRKGGAHTYHVTAYLLHGVCHDPVGIATVIHDVTERARTQAAADLLALARGRIGTTLDATRTAQELAEVAVRDFADVASVDLLDSVLRGDEPPEPPVDADVPLRRAAFEGVAQMRGVYAVGEPSRFVYPTPYTQVLADLAPRLVDPHSTPSDWLMHDGARAGAMLRAGIHSMIIAPLAVHGRVLGLACFYRGPRHPEPFTTDDVPLAAELANNAAIHIENARRYIREHTLAISLQRSLLPRVLPTVSAVSTCHFHLPGTGQALWFDVIELSSARIGLAIGQIPDQGLAAAATVGRLRTAVSTLAVLDLPPDELLAHLDDAAQRIAREGSPPESCGAAHACCQYAVYDPVDGHLTMASAGWPPPLITPTAGATPETLEQIVGPPLGNHASYESVEIPLAPESLLTLYSPSLLGTGPQADQRLSRLREISARPTADPKATCDAIVYSLLREPPPDGVALLAIRTHRLARDQVASWRFPPEASSVADCRHRVRGQLERWGLDSHAFTAEMVVSELVTNVIRHATGTATVRLIRDQSLTLEVSDGATTAPHLRHARIQDEDGRGLLIVAALTDRWGTRYTEDGKTVWTEEPLP